MCTAALHPTDPRVMLLKHSFTCVFEWLSKLVCKGCHLVRLLCRAPKILKRVYHFIRKPSREAKNGRILESESSKRVPRQILFSVISFVEKNRPQNTSFKISGEAKYCQTFTQKHTLARNRFWKPSVEIASQQS